MTYHTEPDTSVTYLDATDNERTRHTVLHPNKQDPNKPCHDTRCLATPYVRSRTFRTYDIIVTHQNAVVKGECNISH
jgi:hypothetical protein